MLLGFAEETQFPFAPLHRRCALVYEMLHGGDLYRRQGCRGAIKASLKAFQISETCGTDSVRFCSFGSISGDRSDQRTGLTRHRHASVGSVPTHQPLCQSTFRRFSTRLQRDDKPYLWHDRLRTATEAPPWEARRFSITCLCLWVPQKARFGGIFGVCG